MGLFTWLMILTGTDLLKLSDCKLPRQDADPFCEYNPEKCLIADVLDGHGQSPTRSIGQGSNSMTAQRLPSTTSNPTNVCDNSSGQSKNVDVRPLDSNWQIEVVKDPSLTQSTTTHTCINGQPTDLSILINSTGVGVVVIPVVAAGVILAGLGAVPPLPALPIPADPPGQPSPDTGDSSNDDPDDDEPPHPDPEPSRTRSIPPQTGNVLMSSSLNLNYPSSSPSIGVTPSSSSIFLSASLRNSMSETASATNSVNASYIAFENLLEPELGGDEKDPRIAGIASEMEERIRLRRDSRCASNQTQSEISPSVAATQTPSNTGSPSNSSQTATASPSVPMQAQPSSYMACGQYTTDASKCPPECPFAAFGGVDTGVANQPGFSTGICSTGSSSSSTKNQINMNLDKSKSLTYSPTPKIDYFTPQVLSTFTIKDPETPGKEGTCSALFVGTQLTVGQPCMPRTFSFQILSRTSDPGSNTYNITWRLDHTVQYFGAVKPPEGLETVVVKSLKIDVTCHTQDCSQIGQTAATSTVSNAPAGFSGDQANAKRKRSRFDDQPAFVT